MTFIRFHKIDEPNGYLSNWYMSSFILDGKEYCCSEQYMMEQKALLFGCPDIAEQIMNTDNQGEMQSLGRSVQNFNTKIWDGMKQLIVYKAVKAKFEQNPDIDEQLKATGDAILVECSVSDKTWGVGLNMFTNEYLDMNNWKGKNLLGFILMMVRKEL